MDATELWIQDLQAAISLIDAMDVDERQRRTLRRACAEAIVEAEDRLEFDYEHRNSGHKWTKQDLELLENELQEAKPCKSWAEEEITLGMLVQKLGRNKKSVKRKAIELGHGRKVDYWIHREQG